MLLYLWLLNFIDQTAYFFNIVSEFRRELQKLDANGNNVIDSDQQINFKPKALKEYGIFVFSNYIKQFS